MRKRSHYRPRPAKAPCLVVLNNIPEMGITERMSVESFRLGFASTDHFDNLADCRDMLTLAAAERDDKSVLVVCELGLEAMLSIKERYQSKGRFGATGEEIKALEALVDVSEDFWKRQSGDVFARHYDAMKRHRLEQAKRRTA